MSIGVGQATGYAAGNRDRFSLEGRVSLVIGASQGIGSALAIGMARAGSDMVLCSSNKRTLADVKREIEALDVKSEVLSVDIRKTADLANLKRFCLERFGKVDVLVNSAGVFLMKEAWQVTESDWDSLADIHLKAVYFCCQVIGSLMREQRYGKIINLSSTLSQSTTVGLSVYAALKAGLSQLTKALALEWAKDGIRVNALAPTAIRTPSRDKGLRGEELDSVIQRIPLGRLATTEDLIGPAIFLASEASDFITGQTIFVDGGWTSAS